MGRTTIKDLARIFRNTGIKLNGPGRRPVFTFDLDGEYHGAEFGSKKVAAVNSPSSVVSFCEINALGGRIVSFMDCHFGVGATGRN